MKCIILISKCFFSVLRIYLFRWWIAVNIYLTHQFKIKEYKHYYLICRNLEVYSITTQIFAPLLLSSFSISLFLTKRDRKKIRPYPCIHLMEKHEHGNRLTTCHVIVHFLDFGMRQNCTIILLKWACSGISLHDIHFFLLHGWKQHVISIKYCEISGWLCNYVAACYVQASKYFHVILFWHQSTSQDNKADPHMNPSG